MASEATVERSFSDIKLKFLFLILLDLHLFGLIFWEGSFPLFPPLDETLVVVNMVWSCVCWLIACRLCGIVGCIRAYGAIP